MFEFSARRYGNHESCNKLSDIFPDNPFFTDEYAIAREARGERVWLFSVLENKCIKGGCFGFVKTGMLRKSLVIPSVSDEFDDEYIWNELIEWLKVNYITDFTVNSFSTNIENIPLIPNEDYRIDRKEYILSLNENNIFSGMRKGHKCNLKKSDKRCLKLIKSSSFESCYIHADLINKSMERKVKDGGVVDPRVRAKIFWPLVKNKAGVIYQAVDDGSVLASNLVLLSSSGAYNHTQGSSVQGMEVGAPQFLIREIALLLSVEGYTLFNLGGISGLNQGLDNFKKGFGSNVKAFPLVSVKSHPVSSARKIKCDILSLICSWFSSNKYEY